MSRHNEKECVITYTKPRRLSIKYNITNALLNAYNKYNTDKFTLEDFVRTGEHIGMDEIMIHFINIITESKLHDKMKISEDTGDILYLTYRTIIHPGEDHTEVIETAFTIDDIKEKMEKELNIDADFFLEKIREDVEWNNTPWNDDDDRWYDNDRGQYY